MNASSDLQALEEGQVVNGKWEIIEFIAKGGKGEVYLATQLNLDRKVALKVMSKEFLDSLEDRTEEYESELQRFRREVRVMARIRHPNVLQVFDFDQVQVDGTTLDSIAMEYVPGPTLRQTMLQEGFQKDEPAIAEWLSRYFFPVLQGMEAVHAKGVVHRDMKPENVLIDDEVPKIADFGLAGGHQLDDITKSFHVIGTPPYMPEEQSRWSGSPSSELWPTPIFTAGTCPAWPSGSGPLRPEAKQSAGTFPKAGQPRAVAACTT